MAITFPRTMPDIPIVGLTFDIEPEIEVTPLRSGRHISADLGPSLWRARWDADNLDARQIGEARAWYDTLLSMEEFYGFDRLREYPLAYEEGWGDLEFEAAPFNGTATLMDVLSGAGGVVLGGLPDGFVLSPGDYLAFDYGDDMRALHRVSEAAVAESGGVLGTTVRPFVRDGWEVGATVFLYRASARMIIVPRTWSSRLTAPYFGSASFEAIQVI
jgi:hypothetical protein